ncbi:MAG: aminoacyl-tRNA hydrolase [Patescibacteria group bacterium]
MSYVILGLGNPGKEYEKTRHNAGRMLVELLGKKENFPEFTLRKAGGVPSLVSEGKFGKQKALLALPEIYMNTSGKAAKTFVKSKKAAADLLVVRDDIDLPLGVIKMTFGRGAGGHHGVESVMRAIGTKEFAQLKIGVSKTGKKNQAKKPGSDDGVVKLVIGKFAPSEEATLKKVLKKGVEAATLFVTDGLERATMHANTR